LLDVDRPTARLWIRKSDAAYRKTARWWREHYGIHTPQESEDESVLSDVEQIFAAQQAKVSKESAYYADSHTETTTTD
jgi:hypothetical protein